MKEYVNPYFLHDELLNNVMLQIIQIYIFLRVKLVAIVK